MQSQHKYSYAQIRILVCTRAGTHVFTVETYITLTYYNLCKGEGRRGKKLCKTDKPDKLVLHANFKNYILRQLAFLKAKIANKGISNS